MKKVPKQFLPPSSLLPRRIYIGGDALEVDVVETGPIHHLSFTARERPAPSGISIGRAADGGAGTLGCVVIDNTDGSTCILSNNHVLANFNNAAIGDAVIQPGGVDGGASPADNIATLKRFIPLMPTGNPVDCAIAQVSERVAANVIDQMKNNLMPTPTPNHPAVGLLFAGGCNRTFFNPIDEVLKQLNISLPGGPGSTTGVDFDVSVEKVGRTTEYTTSSIIELDASPKPNSPNGVIEYVNQLASFWMSDAGDSGSIVCRGGDGGHQDNCDCGTTTATSGLLGVDLSTDVAIEREFRDRYLSRTRVGRYLLDLFFRNEERIIDRVREAKVSDSDRAFARYLYDKHGDEGRRVLLHPTSSEVTLSEEHLRDAREALGRAEQYLDEDERHAAEELFKIIYRARDKSARDILTMLDSEDLLKEVMHILSSVRSLEQPPPRRRSDHDDKAQ
jgi:hypothetical protein